MRWRDFSESVEGIVLLGLVVSLAASALYDFLNLQDHSIRLRRCLVSSATYACCRIRNLFVPEAVKSQCDLEGGDYQKLKTDSDKGDGSGRIAWLLRTTSSSLGSFFRQATDGINQQRGINKNPDPSELDQEPSENDLEPVDGDDAYASPTGELSSYQRSRRRMTERRKKKKKNKYQSRDSWKAASGNNFDFERGAE